jgi:MOSC domain-containing protein YiiM
VAVSSKPEHGVWKQGQPSIRVVAGFGVEGDAHYGSRVQHRSRARQFPDLPNYRQVHLLPSELHDELRAAGMPVAPGEMGENVTTRGIDLLALPTGAVLRLGASAKIEITGLRNPCPQLEEIHEGLMAAALGRDGQGQLVRKAGVMAVVVQDGAVQAGDSIEVELPPEPHLPLQPV